MSEMQEFCWRCHGHRSIGKAAKVVLPAKCDDVPACSKEMADKAPIEPFRPAFDFSEFDNDLRFAAWSIMGAVALIIVAAIIFA